MEDPTMNKRTAVYLLPLAGLMLTGCIRDRLPDCPPLSVTIDVKDKNYFNINTISRLGIMEAKAENLPFREYVHSLYYEVTDEKGNIVARQTTAAVDNDNAEQTLRLDTELPYGKYKVSVWGNLNSDFPLDENTPDDVLQSADVMKTDVYIASGTFDYRYGNENFKLSMERAKGNLLIRAEGLPDNIDFSTKDISNVYSLVGHNLSYSKPATMHTATEWLEPNRIQTQTLLCPSTSFEASTLSVTFADKSTVQQSDADTNMLQPDDVRITMGRNEVTVLKYVYDQNTESFTIYAIVNDNWEVVHGMEIE